jgi:uncharacterized protein YabE (DUF348 family)
VLRFSPLPLLVTLVLIFAILIGGGLYFMTARSVMLDIDGRVFTVRTHRDTVGGMFDELMLEVDPEDEVSPQRDTAIQPGMQITIDKAVSVAVTVDGEVRRVRTHSADPRQILKQAGIALDTGDRVVVDGDITGSEAQAIIPQAIHVIRTKTIRLIDGDQTTTILTSASTVGEVLDEAGVVLFVADLIEPDPAAAIADGDTIRVSRSAQVFIQADGKRLATRTHGKTVADALADSGVAPVGLDYVVPAESTGLTPDMTIRLVRVTEAIVVERQDVRFRTITRTDPTLAAGEQRIIQRGETGHSETRTRVRREDGVEVDRTLESTVTLKEAVDEIIAVAVSTTPVPTPPDDGARG